MDFTYSKNRKCLHCGKLIADQVHAATLFCPRELEADDSMKNCKDDYHAEKNRIKNIPYNNIFNFHVQVNKNIAKMIAHKGESVTIDDLKQYDIPLQRAAGIEILENHLGIYYFVGFSITQHSLANFKISTYEDDFK